MFIKFENFNSWWQVFVIVGSIILLLLLLPTVYLLQQRYYERGRAEPEAVQKGLSFPELLDPTAPEEGLDFSKLPPPAAEHTPDTLVVKFKEQEPTATADQIAAAAASVTSQAGRSVVVGFEPLYPDAKSPQGQMEENRQNFPQRARRAPVGARPPDLRTIYRLSVKPESLEKARQQLARDPQVEWVERETVKYPTQVPDDPLYHYQWWLPKIGLTPIGQDSGWEIEKGKNEVRVATMDWCKYYDGSTPGFDTNHPDLQRLLPEGFNFTSDGTCAGGHETLVTGIIAANTNNGQGVSGENWQVKILPVGDSFRKAVDWGADIISISWHPIDWWLLESARSLGALVVWSAGNRSEELPHRKECDYGLVVAATDQSDRKTSWSNWGDCVAIAAPGTSIFTTTATSRGGWGYGTGEGPLSLALSPSKTPYVAFYEAGRQRLLLLTFADGRWIQEVVDGSGNVGFYTSLKVDARGRLHLSYYDESRSELKYAFKEGFWQYETVDSGGRDGVLALDAEGNPLLAYYKGGRLIFARKIGGVWQKEEVDAQGNVGGWPSLTVSTDGAVGISYYDFSNKSLKFAFKEAGADSWQKEAVYGEGGQSLVGYGSSLQFTPDGRAAISFIKRGLVSSLGLWSDFLYYTEKTTAGWQTELIRGGSDHGGGNYELYSFGQETSLQFDSSRRPRIASLWGKYHLTVDGTRWLEEDFRILRKDESWKTASVVAKGDSAFPGYQNDYIFDSDSREYVLYRVPGRGDLMFGQGISGSWGTEKVGEIVSPYASASGTSFSAPMVAGAAALVAAQHPEYTVDEIRQALLAGADELEDRTIGAGRLNIKKTLAQGRPSETAKISGTVKLQARQSFAGVTVVVSGQEVLTDASGHFELEVAPGTQRVSAIFPGYLESQTEVTVVAEENRNLGETELKGGDGNGDGVVNIFDMVAVGLNFGRRSEAAEPRGLIMDFNADGWVNIFDLTMIGINFHLSAPRPW